MARATSEKVGRGPCPDCGTSLIFRRSSGGMLCHKCDECDSSGYATPGGIAYKKRMASITHPAAPDTPAPPAAVTPKASPKTPDTPMPKAPASVFNLADL
jgi:ssDNA-binding Zn-finger/Zn-ribbon topoisomerase 1